MREIKDTVTRDDVAMKWVVLGPGEHVICLDERGEGRPVITSAGGGEGTVVNVPPHRKVIVGTDAELSVEAERVQARNRPVLRGKTGERYARYGEVEEVPLTPEEKARRQKMEDRRQAMLDKRAEREGDDEADGLERDGATA